MKTCISLIVFLFLTAISFGQEETYTADDYGDFECVRSLPEPVLLKEYFQDAQFEFLKKERKGIETASFGNGGRLTIENSGCEFFVLSFHFETDRFQANPNNYSYWYEAVLTLMNEIMPGLDSPLDIESGNKKLARYIAKNKSKLKFNVEIDYGGDDIRSFIYLDQVEKLNDGKFRINISYALGPL